MAMCSKHVVLLPFPAQGHVLPMIYLARKLASLGIAVTIINIDSIHETVSREWKMIQGQDIRLESIPMTIKAPNGFKDMTAAAAFLEAVDALEDPLAALLAKLNSDHSVSCVISSFYHFPAAEAAAKAGIPSVSYWSGSAAWASIQFYQSFIADAGLLPVDDLNGNELVSNLPGLKPFRAKYLPLHFHKQQQQHKVKDLARAHSRGTRRLATESWILVNSIYELEPQVFDALRGVLPARTKLVSVGPLFPLRQDQHQNELEASLRPENHESLAWLDRQAPRSVIYISFGSIASLSAQEFEELARGVEASKQPFLMVASRDLVSDLDESFFERFVEEAARSGAGMVVTWAPQLAVLQHRSVGGFLTHCGWNSILESLSSGVPMLGWPCISDQNTNCEIIVKERKIGMELREKSCSGVCDGILSLMTSETMRIKALQHEILAREAGRTSGSSSKNIWDFVNSL